MWQYIISTLLYAQTTLERFSLLDNQKKQIQIGPTSTPFYSSNQKNKNPEQNCDANWMTNQIWEMRLFGVTAIIPIYTYNYINKFLKLNDRTRLKKHSQRTGTIRFLLEIVAMATSIRHSAERACPFVHTKTSIRHECLLLYALRCDRFTATTAPHTHTPTHISIGPASP